MAVMKKKKPNGFSSELQYPKKKKNKTKTKKQPIEQKKLPDGTGKARP